MSFRIFNQKKSFAVKYRSLFSGIILANIIVSKRGFRTLSIYTHTSKKWVILVPHHDNKWIGVKPTICMAWLKRSLFFILCEMSLLEILTHRVLIYPVNMYFCNLQSVSNYHFMYVLHNDMTMTVSHTSGTWFV